MAVPGGKLGWLGCRLRGALSRLRQIPVRERDRTHHRRRADRIGHRQGVGIMMELTIGFIGCGAMGAPIADG